MKSLKYLVLAAICCGAWWSTTPADAGGVPSDVVIYLGLPTSFSESQEPIDYNTFVSAFNPITIALTEGSTTNSVVSDFVYTDANLLIHFASADEAGNFATLLFLPPTVFLPETGGLQDVSNYFGLAPLTLEVQSDVEATPLPAALPLFASGLGVMGFLAKRRKRKNAADIAAA